MKDVFKNLLKPLQRAAQLYAGLSMHVRFVVFGIMSLPVAFIFMGVWFALSPYMEEGNFLRWLIAVICSMGPFLLFLIGLSHLSTMNLKTSNDVSKDEDLTEDK